MICGQLYLLQTCSVLSTLCFQFLDLWHRFLCCQGAAELLQLCKWRLHTNVHNIPFQRHAVQQKHNPFSLEEYCANQQDLVAYNMQNSNILVQCKLAQINGVPHLHLAVCSSGWGSAPLHWALKSDSPWPSGLHPSSLWTEPEGEISSYQFHLSHTRLL